MNWDSDLTADGTLGLARAAQAQDAGGARAIREGRLLSVSEEGHLFWRMRLQVVRNLVRQTLRQSRLRLAIASTLSALLWIGLFALFTEGFQFLGTAIPDAATLDETTRAIFNLFFASLTLMLLISTGIFLYVGLFRSAETRFLLTTCARAERIFLHKLQESLLFASWAFVLLGSPMLVSHGVAVGASWYYYLVLVPFLVTFVFIPGAAGAIACLLIVRHLPKSRKQFLALILAAVALGLWAVGWVVTRGLDSDPLTPTWFQEMLEQVQFSENRLLPSWWLSTGLLEASRGGWGTLTEQQAFFESVLFLCLLIANAMFLHLVAVWTARRVYRTAFSSLSADRAPRRRAGAALVDRALWRMMGFLGVPTRLLIIKDLRLFRRDPLQWQQFLLFFGLLGLYFFNMRNLSYDVTYASWVNMISFLNLAVVGLILATFTTRFIFPLISLEGRRFWALGLLPVGRDTILWGKFLFASVGAILPCSLLVFLSDAMVRVNPLIVVVHQGVCLLLCIGLAGIAVGLGARFPNLRAESSARIAAGFGGTLNLVVSTAYIALVVVASAVPCHIYLAAHQTPDLTGLLDTRGLWAWLAGGTACSVLLASIATILPMRIGIKVLCRKPVLALAC